MRGRDQADCVRGRLEAERQLEWAEVYLAAAEGVDLDDRRLSLEVRRLRTEVEQLRRTLARPRVL